MKHIKISPDSKSYNSQQEVKSCFGIRWDAFHRQGFLQVCRKQTSSAGKEQWYKTKTTPAFHNGAPFLGIDSI